MQDFIARLIEESKRFLNERSQIDDDIGQEAAKFVAREIPAPSGTFEKSDSPLIRWIEEAIQFGSPETERVLNALKPALPFLPWKYNYEPRADMPDLGNRMGWGEILGPEAPYHDEHFCFGFTLLQILVGSDIAFADNQGTVIIIVQCHVQIRDVCSIRPIFHCLHMLVKPYLCLASVDKIKRDVVVILMEVSVFLEKTGMAFTYLIIGKASLVIIYHAGIHIGQLCLIAIVYGIVPCL